MIEIKSDALQVVNKALGVAGTGGAGNTQLQDGILDQVLDVGALARRGRTLASRQGIYTAIMRNQHTNAESLTITTAPYNQTGANVVPPYPAPVPDRFDIWLLSAVVTQLSGSGTLTATLSIFYAAVQLAWGLNNSGSPVTGATEHPVAFWDALATENTLTMALRNGARGPFAPIGVRLPRSDSTFIRFRSTSSATSIFDCLLTFGLFPVGMGQDAIV